MINAALLFLLAAPNCVRCARPNGACFKTCAICREQNRAARRRYEFGEKSRCVQRRYNASEKGCRRTRPYRHKLRMDRLSRDPWYRHPGGLKIFEMWTGMKISGLDWPKQETAR